MNPTIEQLEAAIAAANKKLAELKAADAAQAEKAWPQIDDTYWALDDSAEVFVTTWAADDTDCARTATGNVFRTEAEAEHEIDRRKVLTELRRLAKESWDDSVPDWINTRQGKWRLCYDHSCNTWRVVGNAQDQNLGAVYFVSEEAALTAVETIGADRLMLLLEE